MMTPRGTRRDENMYSPKLFYCVTCSQVVNWVALAGALPLLESLV